VAAAIAGGAVAQANSHNSKSRAASHDSEANGNSHDSEGNRNSHDSEGNRHGSEADRATAAALKATHGGHANSVERDTENGATWEVEVTKTNGDTVDVRLDENYKVVVIEGDSESSDEGDSGD
jgi:hypothetical protein